ncbi:hypothetical protein HIM_01912 [Hirsutella minnesotensis 3608]|nr:hypothetical protein HIM_01912 [Hirsutella minnesotensis 3608]
MEYAMKEVVEHRGPDDAWIVIHGEVYDVTKYHNDHPGGAEVLIEAAGTDASEAFDNAGHSEDAFDIMKEYNVGKLKGFKKPAPKPTLAIRPPSPPPSNTTTKASIGSKLASLGLISVTAASAYFVSQHTNISLPTSLVSALKARQPQRQGVGFLEGLLLGAGALAILDVFIMQKAMGLLKSAKSFTNYPAHIKIPRPVDNNVLLDRGWLDPINYAELPLIKKTSLSPNVYRLAFALPTSDAIVELPTGQHVTIKGTVNGESVARSYTPVSNNSDKGMLELVIKVYPDGKLTNGYLANLEVGDQVLFRGPKGAMRYDRGTCKKIGMVAGGTGITPMYQLIRAICEDDRDTTEISLIYANRSEQDILLREELDRFARRYPKNLKVYYMLDNPPAGWEYGSGHVTKDIMAERLPEPSESSKVLLCGPPGMIKAAKSSLVDLGFEQPGASAKMTDKIFLF